MSATKCQRRGCNLPAPDWAGLPCALLLHLQDRQVIALGLTGLRDGRDLQLAGLDLLGQRLHPVHDVGRNGRGEVRVYGEAPDAARHAERISLVRNLGALEVGSSDFLFQAFAGARLMVSDRRGCARSAPIIWR